MELLSRLQEDMKAAMKSGQKDRLQLIRMLNSDLMNIDLNPAEYVLRPMRELMLSGYGWDHIAIGFLAIAGLGLVGLPLTARNLRNVHD